MFFIMQAPSFLYRYLLLAAPLLHAALQIQIKIRSLKEAWVCVASANEHFFFLTVSVGLHRSGLYSSVSRRRASELESGATLN